MRWIGNIARLVSTVIAGCVLLLVVTQTTGAFPTAILTEAPAAANLHLRLTRHCVEEVSGEELDLSAAATGCFGAGEACAAPMPLFCVAEAELPDTMFGRFHRKILHPSPEDG